MSQPFTILTNSSDTSKLAIANEIIQSYNEHVDVLGASGMWPRIALLSDAAYLSSGIFNTIQWFMAYNAHFFIDHEDPLTADKGAFNYYSEDSWLARAGLNPSGFQYSWDGVNFNYAKATTGGQIVLGQVRGPWNFSDIQKGLSALRWLPWTNYTGNTLQKKQAFGYGSPYNYDEAWIMVQDDWITQPWVSSTDKGYVVYVDGDFIPFYGRIYHADRYCASYDVAFPDVDGNALVGRGLNIYIKNSCWTGTGYVNFDEVDGNQNEYGLYRTIPSFTGTHYTTEMFGQSENFPAYLHPEVKNLDGERTYAAQMALVATWNFTYQND